MLIQSALFGDKVGNAFNDVEALVGSANIATTTGRMITQIDIIYGSVIDGIKITYNADGLHFSKSHGSSTINHTDKNTRSSSVVLNCYESIIAISGKAGTTRAYGTRVVQLNFVIYDSSTGAVRIAGPFGGNQGKAFRVTANGAFVAFGGYAINTKLSVGELKAAGVEGGLYGLTFSEFAYRTV